MIDFANLLCSNWFIATASICSILGLTSTLAVTGRKVVHSYNSGSLFRRRNQNKLSAIDKEIRVLKTKGKLNENFPNLLEATIREDLSKIATNKNLKVLTGLNSLKESAINTESVEEHVFKDVKSQLKNFIDNNMDRSSEELVLAMEALTVWGQKEYDQRS